MGRAAAALVFLLALAACERRAPSSGDTAAVEREVRAAVEAFAEAERRRDVGAILSFLSPDFYMYADGVRIDHDTVTEQIRSTMPALQRFETTWSDVEISPLAPDVALVSLVFRDAVTDADGVTTRLRGPTTFVWRMRDGQWRILYADADHYPDEP